MVPYDRLFHFFTIYPLPHGPKSTRLNKIHISTNNSYISEVNFGPSWKNTLGNLVPDSIADYSLFFAVITDIIVSNTFPHIVV